MDAKIGIVIIIVSALVVCGIIAWTFRPKNVHKNRSQINHTTILFKSGASITYNHTEFNVQIGDKGRVIYLKIKQSNCNEVDPMFMDYDEIIAIQETTPKPYSPTPFIG